MVRVLGNLVDPIGLAVADTQIRVTALENEGETLMALEAVVTTDSDGGYEFQIVNGKHNIEVLFSNRQNVVGEVVISDGMSDITLPELLDLFI